MTELWKLDATAQAALVRAGEVTAAELVEQAIARGALDAGYKCTILGGPGERRLRKSDTCRRRQRRLMAAASPIGQ